jgi:hypothetical protein
LNIGIDGYGLAQGGEAAEASDREEAFGDFLEGMKAAGLA